MENLDKRGLNVCGPCGPVNMQQINSNLTYPDADKILKNVKLEFVHVDSVVLLKDLKAHGQWISQPLI